MESTLSYARCSAKYALVRDDSAEVTYLRVLGELDLSVAVNIDNALTQMSMTVGETALDLSACTYIDSTIIAVMIRAHRRLEGRFVIILPVGHPIRRTLAIAGVVDRLPIRSE